MKKLILVIPIFLYSCSENEYNYIGQEIIDGKVSALSEGRIGRNTILPKIWVQNSKQTKEVSIPFEYENKWKVGDSCLLIIEKYEVIKND